MATLADEFLQDLGDEFGLDDMVEKSVALDKQHQEALLLAKQARVNDLESVTQLLRSPTLASLLQKLDMDVTPTAQGGDDREWGVLVECNEMTQAIGAAITDIHAFVRDLYAPKLAELDTLVPNPLDYARVVRRIANETDITLVDLADILPSATVMVVSVTASTTSGKKLSDEHIKAVLQACDDALALDDIRKRILSFVESKMHIIAPNLTAMVGSAVAAKLVGAAGGLSALSKLPASTIQALGTKRNTLQGFSSKSTISHVGYIFESDIINHTPPSLREKACRLVATKCTLAARIDGFHESPDGSQGQELREAVEKKIEKWQEPPPPKLPKPLPAPDDQQKKRRGGKRARKLKEKYAMTELRKHQNRVTFGVGEDEQEDSKTLGPVGKPGKIRLLVTEKSGLVKSVTKKQKQKHYGSGNASGLSSSFALTPFQGVELENPEAAAKKAAELQEINQRYFSEAGGFFKVQKKDSMQS